MKDDRKEKIEQEIEKTGFPVELRVAEMLRTNGYYVRHSDYYIDRDEKKARELDIRAIKVFMIKSPEGNELFLRINLMIECKRSKNKPWVFLSSPKGHYDPRSSEVPFLPQLSDVMITQTREVEKIHPFSKYHMMGRSYFEAFKNSENAESIFKALTTAVKSSLYYIEDDSEDSLRRETYCLYYPLIVFDGEIFQGVLSDKKIEVEERDSILVCFNYPTPDYLLPKFAVPVLNENALRKLLLDFDACHSALAKKIESFLPEFRLKTRST